MDAITSLRSEIDSWDWLARVYKKRANRLIDAVETQLYDEMIRIGRVSEILGVSERQVHNLAADPDTPIWKYNEDGTRKTTNRRTKTRYRLSEVEAYKNEKEGSMI